MRRTQCRQACTLFTGILCFSPWRFQPIAALSPSDILRLARPCQCLRTCVQVLTRRVPVSVLARNVTCMADSSARPPQVAAALLRLPQVAADLAVQLNTPTHISPASTAAEHTGAGGLPGAAAAPALLLRALKTLNIRDWGLFGKPCDT